MPSSRRISSIGIGTGLVLVAVVGGILWYGKRTAVVPPGSTPSTSTAPSPGAAPASGRTEFVNDRIRREIATQGLTVDRARQLFVLEATALPGVVAPEGDVRPVFSGTYALTQLIGVRDKLTPEQRARLDELLDAKRSVFPSGMPPIARPKLPAIRLVSLMGDPPTGKEEDAYRAAFMEMYEWANEAVGKLTGRPKVPSFTLVFENLSGPNWALSGPWQDGKIQQAIVNGKPVDTCLSRIDVRKFDLQPIAAKLSVVVHEVTHCYQQFAVSTADQVTYTAGWLHDGEATWAQMVVVPEGIFEALQTHWRDYLTDPTTHLFERKYDAAGFFGHVADVTDTDTVAKRLIPAFVAGGFGRNETAYQTMVAGVEDKVLDTWAPSYFRAHENQFLWTVKGPGSGNIPSEKATPEALTVGPGETIALTGARPWELSLISLESTADVVSIVAGQGHVALIDRTEQVNKTLSPMEPITLCVKGDCTCPPNTEGEIPPTIPALAKIDIGITGGTTGAFGWAHGEKIEDYCDPKKEKPPIMGKLPNGITGGGIEQVDDRRGFIASDPHIATLDGRWYDLQAIGEFVLTKSTTDDFAVQVRLGTIGDLRTVSVATALATKVGKDRVTVSIDPASASPVPVLRINGEPMTNDFAVLRGGSVRSVFNEAGTGYVIEFADRTRVRISPFARQGLNVWVVPSPARAGTLTGLLGDDDGNAANDPVVAPTAAATATPAASAAPTVLAEAPSYDDLYTTFANSWRITSGESLFDYGAGQTTETFTDRGFPDRHAVAASAAAIATAEGTCKAGGITDANLLRNCAFDVAATGHVRYVRAYQPEQGRADLARELAALRGTGVVTTTVASARTKSVVLEGRVTDAAADAFATFDGFKNDIIYLDPDTCQKPRFMQMLGPDGKAVAGAGNAPACGLRLPLPADGTYKLALNPFHDFSGPYKMAITVVRPDRVTTIAAGDTLTGTLAARAEHDVFLVTVKSPGAITIGGGAGCDANFDVTVYFGDDEVVGAGPACRIGQVTLPKAGTYRIVTNPFNNTTGTYRIPTS